jgi:hypothetical protein
MELFTPNDDLEGRNQPLAERMRPGKLDEFVGQRHILGEGKLLRRLIESDQVTSIILWGPPGSGKTTLARIIANSTKSHFISFHRRDPPLQQGAAGRLSPLRGERYSHYYRGNHGKSVIRGNRAASFPLQGTGALSFEK